MMQEGSKRRKRERARLLFLTGECASNAEIARRLGLKPHTVAKYRKDEGWDDLVLKADRRAAERLIEKLADERSDLNAQHFRFWAALLAQAGLILKQSRNFEIKDLERLALLVDRAQKGQRLARGLSLSGETEEQIKAQGQAELRSLVDAFVESVKEIPDEEVRERIRLAVLARLPGEGLEDERENRAG